jgi:hypothetical protein
LVERYSYRKLLGAVNVRALITVEKYNKDSYWLRGTHLKILGAVKDRTVLDEGITLDKRRILIGWGVQTWSSYMLERQKPLLDEGILLDKRRTDWLRGTNLKLLQAGRKDRSPYWMKEWYWIGGVFCLAEGKSTYMKFLHA